jgi:two-component system nitrogen regulation response regulator NtrX
VVIELFDKQGQRGGLETSGFNSDDNVLVRAAADFGAEMLRQALSQRQMHQLLLDAVGAALGASASVTESLRTTAEQRREEPPPAAVLDQLRAGLCASPTAPAGADDTLRLVEAIRVLALRHGPGALQHCTRLVHSTRALLDAVAGTGEAPP